MGVIHCYKGARYGEHVSIDDSEYSSIPLPESVALSRAQYADLSKEEKAGRVFFITDDIDSSRQTSRLIRVTCARCGASLPVDSVPDSEVCRCEYCRSWNIVREFS